MIVDWLFLRRSILYRSHLITDFFELVILTLRDAYNQRRIPYMISIVCISDALEALEAAHEEEDLSLNVLVTVMSGK